MRIATSTIYDQQTATIDNQTANYSTLANELSTGKTLNAPSDNPGQIGQDLGLITTLAGENQNSTNIQNATAQLNTTDSALANVTSLLQSARSLAVQGASDTLSKSQQQSIATQVDELLQQAVAIGNTQYNGQYIFAGTAQQNTPPVSTQGSPISGVTFSGNEQVQGQLLYNNQQFALSATFQQSFNYQAADGSPDVFQVLTTLRDTLNKGLVVDQSSAAVNQPGQVVYGPQVPATAPAPTTLGNGGGGTPFAVQPQPDNGVPPGYSITINNADANGVQHVETYNFTAATAVDDGTATSIVGQINANTATTGLTASFDAKTQQLVLTNPGGGSFYVTDVASPGGTTTSNFTKVFNLQSQADLPNTVSTQLANIDNALNVVLNARAVVGSRVNALAQISAQTSTDITENTQVKSGIEDTNIAQVTSQFTEAQTVLQAAYATTSKLEGKILFDYL